MSATTSPQKDKVGWVKFDNETSKAEIEEVQSPSRSSSGVSSARGSVNSATVPDEVDEAQGGVLAVSETRVVDEHSLRQQQPKNGTINHQNSHPPPPVFKQMSSSSPAKTTSPTTSDSLDNVNLNDETIHQSPSHHSQSADHIRGRRFTNGEIIVTLLPVNERLPWITPAKFRPELVPEELMAPILTVCT